MRTASTRLLPLAILTAVLATLTGCRLFQASQPEEPVSQGNSLSLLEQQLLTVIQMEKELDQLAAIPDVDHGEVYRLFMQVAQEYKSIISRNERHLETRLLFGKLLSRFGDAEGARDQFLAAAAIDPNIAVIHQQLSTYYAEEADFTRALAYALNAVRIEPDTAAYHYGLGQVLAAFRDQFLKEEIFSPDKIDADILDAFKTAIDLQPDSLPLRFRYGEAFYDVGNPDWNLALQHWQHLALQPGLPPLQLDAVRLHQARCLIELGLPEQARTITRDIQNPQILQSARLLQQQDTLP
ncbi:MAG: tetratricopeptide repeat protein [Opitutales bacterium]|jgi:tetratricopeptide (TPR) repeat protein